MIAIEQVLEERAAAATQVEPQRRGPPAPGLECDIIRRLEAQPRASAETLQRARAARWKHGAKASLID